MSHVNGRGTPLGADDRAKLRALIARVGEPRAAAELLVGRNTLARALAGLGVRRGTALLIVTALRDSSAARSYVTRPEL